MRPSLDETCADLQENARALKRGEISFPMWQKRVDSILERRYPGVTAQRLGRGARWSRSGSASRTGTGPQTRSLGQARTPGRETAHAA